MSKQRQNPIAYRQKNLADAIGVTRQTIHNWEREGVLPPRIEITPGVKVWPATVIEGWLSDRARNAGGH